MQISCNWPLQFQNKATGEVVAILAGKITKVPEWVRESAVFKQCKGSITVVEELPQQHKAGRLQEIFQRHPTVRVRPDASTSALRTSTRLDSPLPQPAGRVDFGPPTMTKAEVGFIAGAMTEAPKVSNLA